MTKQEHYSHLLYTKRLLKKKDYEGLEEIIDELIRDYKGEKEKSSDKKEQ